MSWPSSITLGGGALAVNDLDRVRSTLEPGATANR